jgi:EAL domain-containing protein (putative c-di-GMP-specific phosphodiesterase class I)/GGDEF domain-containing protein
MQFLHASRIMPKPSSPRSRGEILATLDDLVAQDATCLIALVRVDRMKSVNHLVGVNGGDQLLTELGRRMIESVGSPERVGLLRGGIFMLLIESTGGDPTQQAHDIVASLNHPVGVNGLSLDPDLKVGVTVCHPEDNDIDQLLVSASAALRSARNSLAHDLVVADQTIRAQALIEKVVDRDIASALAANKLSFVFQPVVSVATSQVRGAEALLRWNHPELGNVPPGLIVERALMQGLAPIFTSWCAQQIAQDWASLVQSAPELDALFVTLNLSEGQLNQRECASSVTQAFADAGLPASTVVVEVVESGPEGVGPRSTETLTALAAAGARIALDDFGTGLNALEYFLKFPIHAVKFDRSLVAAIEPGSKAEVIVRGIARIADELGVATAAEGIEDIPTLETCRALGLTFGQGWHLGHPTPIKDFGVLAMQTQRLVVDLVEAETKAVS